MGLWPSAPVAFQASYRSKASPIPSLFVGKLLNLWGWFMVLVVGIGSCSDDRTAGPSASTLCAFGRVENSSGMAGLRDDNASGIAGWISNVEDLPGSYPKRVFEAPVVFVGMLLILLDGLVYLALGRRKRRSCACLV
jgi:hypothetical protein